MTLGPVEYVLIGFPGNRFKGEIIPALAQLVEAGTIRIIDIVFVKKDADGAMEIFEYDALDEVTDVAEIEGEAGGLLSDEDIAFAAEALEPDCSAALLVWGDRWAAPLADALRNARGGPASHLTGRHDRRAQGTGRSQGTGRAHRGGVRRAEGQDPRRVMTQHVEVR
jgi:hypothetical protein